MVSDKALIVFGSLAVAAGFFLLLGGTVTIIYGAALLIALGNGLMWPSVLAALSKVAGDTHQGAVQGFASSAGAVASIVGLILGGFLYNSIGPGGFAVSSAVILVVAVLALFGKK